MVVMATEIRIGDLHVDPDIQGRIVVDPRTVTEYAEAMVCGDEFPPVTVFDDGQTYWLADGFHRVAAAIQARRRSIQVEILTGGRREAVLYACGANARHGLRRSTQDKRRVVGVLLRDPEWSQWSSREIARVCGVSHPFVEMLRRELGGAVTEGPSIAARVYRTKHGGEARMRTPRRKAQAAALPSARTEIEDLRRELESCMRRLGGGDERA